VIADGGFTLGRVGLRSTSGDIKIDNGLTAAFLNATASSGNIAINGDAEVRETAAFQCTSGDIRVKDGLRAQNLNADTRSGNIRLGTIHVETYSLQCTSGDIKADEISGGGRAATSSGNIDLTLKDAKGDIELAATSGNIRLALETSLSFTLDARSRSGNVRTDFEADINTSNSATSETVGDNPTAYIKVSSNSGNINVIRQ
jgi:lia operon protein LiaG